MVKKNIIIPAVIGNALEWYDFALYGYYASIISHLFFPVGNNFISLIKTFGVFAAGFLMRPLGAIIFGHFGDRVGRKKMLAASVILMALSTTAMGLLPTHAQIGVWAGILLTVCRLLQGLSGGGEYPGSVVYLVEHAPAQHRGLFGSLSLLGSGIGFLLASMVGALTSSFAVGTAYAETAWRFPFLLGIILGAVGLYLRLCMPETPEFSTLLKSNFVPFKYPLLQVLREKKWAMLQAVCLVFSPLMASYLLFVYLPSYLNLYLNLSLHTALIANSIGWLTVIILYPIVGHLSDRLGRRLILMVGALLMCLLVYPLFLLLQQATFATVVITQIIFAALLALYYAVIPVVLVEMFEVKIRYTAVAFPQNLAAVLGGTAPMVVTFLIHSTGNIAAPSFYLILATVIMLPAIFFWRKNEND